MPKRYYLCGMVGDGGLDTPYRPEIVQFFPAGTAWAASREMSDITQKLHGNTFVVAARIDEATHLALAWDQRDNKDGFDWFEVGDDGTVTVHAHQLPQGRLDSLLNKTDGGREFITSFTQALDAKLPEVAPQ